MRRLARHLLLVVALLLAQHGALLHGLEHATHDLDVAMHSEGEAPALGHGIEDCVAYDTIAYALSGGTTLAGAADAPFSRSFSFVSSVATAARTAFDSRAPPFFA